jgi:molybdate transport system substrate-binding protein
VQVTGSRIGRPRTHVLIAACLAVAFLGACGDDDGDNAAKPGPESQENVVATTTSGPPSPGVRIAAASDLQFAIPEVIKAFAEDQPNIPITPTFGSSGNFDTQIRNGAPFDLYFSADVSFPTKLEVDGLAEKGTVFEYAVGRVVVAVAKDSALDVKTLGMKALTDPSVRKIAIANPDHAPYGRAAEAAMKSSGVYDQVKAKLVLGENVSQAAQFLKTGAADVAIVALSLALAPTATMTYFQIPADSHPEILQGGAVLAKAQDKPAAQLFVDFIRGEEGLAIMSRFGFVPPTT